MYLKSIVIALPQIALSRYHSLCGVRFHVANKRNLQYKFHFNSEAVFQNQSFEFHSKGRRANLDYTKVPKLEESDLEEQFVRGSGPGGQATNKTSNAVVLKHKPTGIVVKCHETRSLWDNKKRAREIMIGKLDNMINGKDSVENQERALLAKKSLNNTRKREKMLKLKAAFKEREGID